MGNHLEAALKGLSFFAIGLFLLLRRQAIVRSMLDSHNPIWKPLGKGNGSETVNWVVGISIVTLVGFLLLAAGLLMLISFVTGKDWPLHYAHWEDLWPF
jgi:hypothetical protein